MSTVMATLVYLWRIRPGTVPTREFLMIHRGGRPDDFHSGKWNGLGGKLEALESPWEAASREVREESGLEIGPERLSWQGILHFPNFKPQKGEDWWCCVLTAELSAAEGDQVAEGARLSEEGTLHWVPESALLSLNLWEGDRQFLPRVLAGDPVFGTLRYEQGRVTESRIDSRCPTPFT
jgi:8-oxo-dGTP diphosphatase